MKPQPLRPLPCALCGGAPVYCGNGYTNWYRCKSDDCQKKHRLTGGFTASKAAWSWNVEQMRLSKEREG